MIFDATNMKDGKQAVLDYLKEKKFERVLDVGGAMFPWADEFVTHYFDIQEIPNKNCFVGNVCSLEDWEAFYSWEVDGKLFDFAICTQTIEDIRDPRMVLGQLEDIAKEGFISVPCKHTELCKEIECSTKEDMEHWGIEGLYRGYIHHRWIFTIRDNVLWAIPKLAFIDYLKGLEWATLENKNKYYHELSFRWRGNIPFKIINNDFLGPDGLTLCNMYREALKEGI